MSGVSVWTGLADRPWLRVYHNHYQGVYYYDRFAVVPIRSDVLQQLRRVPSQQLHEWAFQHGVLSRLCESDASVVGRQVRSQDLAFFWGSVMSIRSIVLRQLRRLPPQ